MMHVQCLAVNFGVHLYSILNKVWIYISWMKFCYIFNHFQPLINQKKVTKMHAMAVSLKLIFQEVNLMFNCLQIVVSLDCIFKCNTFLTIMELQSKLITNSFALNVTLLFHDVCNQINRNCNKIY